MPKRSIRHPTRESVRNPTSTPSSISIGKKDRVLLRYLFNNQKERFNVKKYSRDNNISRPTIYDSLNRLNSYELIEKNLGNSTITKKGIIMLEYSEGVSEKGIGSSRRECRKNANLSTHYHKFKLPISDKSKFSISHLKKLNPLKVHENKLFNLHQIIASFEDATVIINPNKLVINLYDIVTSDVDEADFKCLERAIEYAKKFIGIGIETESMTIEEGHWARIQSLLSDFLYKVDNRYFLDLGNGKKFWIDHSLKREDETNDKEARERLDTFLTQIMTSGLNVSDIDKIKESLGYLTTLEAKDRIELVKVMEVMKMSIEINKETAAGLNAVVTYLKSQIPEKKEEEIKPEGRIDYCG